ncbi:hypothetical protein C0993_000669 [Termitomyces sp. T159_Od127]|nr:hypothetical protein C0993_000669 [Termitomyces sp. T159_Od127]
MPGRTLQPGAAALSDKVSVHVPRIFEQAQTSVANHQKNLVALYKLQTEAALCTEEVRKGRKLVGEKIFEEAILHVLLRVLPLKKGVTPADRVVKFIGGYVKFVNEKALEQQNQEGADEDDDTTASRFTACLLRFFFKGFLSKDKNVRYRILQSVAEMVSHLGLVDEDVYSELRSSLMDRANDKEVNVRVQVVIALSKLSGTEGPAEEGEQTVQELLTDIMEHDSSADVRRAAVLNLPIDETTLSAILDRTRDTDTTIRKLVYSAILEKNVTVGDNDQIMGPTHPRALSIAQRELIIRNGLGDREPSVRAAAASLLGRWVDVVGEPAADGEEKPNVKAETGLVQLLKMLDLAEQKYPVDAVLSIFASRPEIFQTMTFGPDFWENLTPETAFLARVFVEHGMATNDNVRLEAVLPVVTEMAFRIQKAFNELTSRIDDEEEARLLTDLTEDEKIHYEDARLEKEAIIGELLQLAVNLDYSDEIGRRKMFQLVRDMLSQELLPKSLLNKCLDVLRKLSPSERDLIRVVVELVQDLRDRTRGDGEEENLIKDEDAETNFGETPGTVKPPRPNPPREQTAEEKARADTIDLKCLLLCIGMLERVNGTLDENSTLEGILEELIIPSVRRKEYIFREKDDPDADVWDYKPLAVNSIKLFVDQVPLSPSSLQESLLQVVFDVFMVHEAELRKHRPEIIPYIMDTMLDLLDAAESDKVRALVGLGLSKLVLAGLITEDEPVLKLLRTYLSPTTESNLELRQCLTFFFQVFCYSSPTNQATIGRMFLKTYKACKEDRETLDEDEGMISPAQITTLFADWTDPNKLRAIIDANGKLNSEHQAIMSVQFDLAVEVLRSLLEENWGKDDKRALCQMLPKLYLPDSADDDKVKRLKVLMYTLRSRRPIRDTITNNAFTKFEAAVMKKYAQQLQEFSEEEYRKLEQLDELFKFVDSIIPDVDDEEFGLDEPRRKGKKRRSDSIMTATTEGDEVTSAGSSKRGRSKPRSKRPRFSNSDDASDDDEVTELHTPPPPTRTVPKRSAATKKPPQTIYVSSGSDEEDYTPAPRLKGRTTKHIKEESEEVTFDSIIDGDEQDGNEEEEEEVHELLAED